MSVFVDTSALFALLVRTDRGHHGVLQAFIDVAHSGRSMHTSSYVILETHALLQHRIGLAPVLDFDERIMPLLAVEWVGAALHNRGVARLRREHRRELSLTDCVSFELMRQLGLQEALALDEHFVQAGYTVRP